MILGSADKLRIDFDELSHDYHRLTYHIDHCEADWSVSEEVFESDWLSGFNNNQIEDYQMSIAKIIERRMFIERMRLERLSDKLPVIFSVYKTRQESRFDSIMNMLKYAAIKRLTKEEHNIEVIERSIPPAINRILINQQHLINLFEQKVEAANPDKLLKRGFSITTHKGKVVKDSSMLKHGDEIETRVNKGVIKSTVSKI
jgi:exodeoxyribonuclease VII large subunit